VTSDEAASYTDHLFVPHLRGPDLVARGRNAIAAGLILAGNDRLQVHRWMIFGVHQFNSAHAGNGGGFGYANRQLAPFTITAMGSILDLRDTPPPAPGAPAPTPTAADFTLNRRERQADLRVTRVFYENPVTLGLALTEDDRPGDPAVAYAPRRVAGPTLEASFTGVETTPVSDARRLLAVDASTAVYPTAWNTIGATLVDARGEIDVALPLPLSRRHGLLLALRGRDVAGLPPGQRWLQVGGGVTALYARRSPDQGVPPDVTADPLPPDLRFYEPLRGYEDHPFATRRVAIGDARYRYPLIIDWGSASSLGVLPSFFLRQLDGVLFGALALDSEEHRHAAAGAAVSLRVAVGPVPVSLSYQLARRLDDDRAIDHLVTVSAE
jgi:hypothetical protein